MRFGSQSSEPPARAQPGMNSNPSSAPRQLAQQLLTAMPLSRSTTGELKELMRTQRFPQCLACCKRCPVPA